MRPSPEAHKSDMHIRGCRLFVEVALAKGNRVEKTLFFLNPKSRHGKRRADRVDSKVYDIGRLLLIDSARNAKSPDVRCSVHFEGFVDLPISRST